MASLCLLGEDGATTERWELGERPVAVGRGEAADVVIDDAALSRRHFVIVRQGQEFLLKDLDSQNGTWVDGRRAQTTRLHHHDCILAGRTLFLFSEPAAAALTSRAKVAA
jgi:pSer/pThr/pTyr-binding forkhead associated (FHA) protein